MKYIKLFEDIWSLDLLGKKKEFLKYLCQDLIDSGYTIIILRNIVYGASELGDIKLKINKINHRNKPLNPSSELIVDLFKRLKENNYIVRYYDHGDIISANADIDTEFFDIYINSEKAIYFKD